MCWWSWLSFVVGIVAAEVFGAVVLALCMLTARKVDEHGNPIVKVRDAG